MEKQADQKKEINFFIDKEYFIKSTENNNLISFVSLLEQHQDFLQENDINRLQQIINIYKEKQDIFTIQVSKKGMETIINALKEDPSIMLFEPLINYEQG